MPNCRKLTAAKASWIKRALDIFGSLVGILALSPFFVVTAFLILFTMGLPVFFRQQRPGYREIPFKIIKFRTMRAPRPDQVWFRSDAERLTKIGYFIRKTSIDELPELWNVLKGEMSIVGPRPLLMEYLPKYTSEQNRRHDVLPGITGWAQVRGRQGIQFSKRIEYDIWYVDHWSNWLDIWIILITVRSLFGSKGVIPGQNVDDIDDLGLSPDLTNKNMEE